MRQIVRSFSLFLFALFLSLATRSFGQNSEQQSRLKLAITLYEKGDYERAQQQLSALSKDPHIPSTLSIQVWNNLGNVYADQGKNIAAIEAYNRALYLAKRESAVLDESKILKNIGAIYMSLGRFKRAENYYLNALKMAKSLNEPKIIADCYNNLGTVYEQTNRLPLAKTTYFKAIEIYNTIQSYPDIAMVSSNLAIVYKTEKQFDSCIYSNKQALTAAISSKDPWMEAAILNNIGNLFGETKQLDSALLYLNHSLKIAQNIDALEIQILALESISDAYHYSNKNKEAFSYLKKMQALQKRFDGLALNQTIEELNVKYKTKEQQLLNAELKTKQRNTIVFGIILTLIIGIGISFFFYAKRKRDQAKHFHVMNAAIIESESTTRMQIANDLHDHIGQKIAVLTMISHQQESDAKANFQQMIQELGNDIRNISHQLVPEAFRFGIVRALEELKSEIERVNGVKLTLDAPKEAFKEFDPTDNLSLFRILQELIANALKHAKANELSVQIAQNKAHYIIKISDNGKGFDQDLIRQSKGIGWKTIASRINALHGSFGIRTTPLGTEIQLIIPNQHEDKD